MRSPKPPAPMKAAIVAVPTLITAEVLMPARIVRRGERQLDRCEAACRARGPSAIAPPARMPRRHLEQPGVGVAHDGQQRVEEERDQRRPRRRCVPVSGIRNASSASDGNGLHHAGRRPASSCATQRTLARRGFPAARRRRSPAASEPKTSAGAGAAGGRSRAPKSGAPEASAARRGAASSPERTRSPTWRRSAALSISARAFMRRIAASSIRPSSLRSARKGLREALRAHRARCSSTAS